MRFLHTSDLHFGAGRRLTPKSLDYLERHKRGIEAVLKTAVKEQVDFILVSGDIFENASTTIDELLAAHELFSMAGEIAPTIVTAGNHDELSVGNFQTEYLKLLSIPNVTFVSKPEVVKVSHRGQTTKIAAIPWTGYKEQERFDQLLAEVVTADVPIVMLHECFIGVTLDSGLVSKGGVKIPNIPHVLYYACGDIHKYQRVQLPHAFYSGAPLQYNFGDQLPKGCLIVDVEGSVYKPRFVEIPQAIELHNITALDQIPAESPHWYKLRVDAANMPKHIPANVKVVEPVARKVDLPIPTVGTKSQDGKEGIESLAAHAVDFTDGVAEILSENGFSQSEIQTTLEEVVQLTIV